MKIDINKINSKIKRFCNGFIVLAQSEQDFVSKQRAINSGEVNGFYTEFDILNTRCSAKSLDGRSICPEVGIYKIDNSLKNDGTFDYLCEKCSILNKNL